MQSVLKFSVVSFCASIKMSGIKIMICLAVLFVTMATASGANEEHQSLLEGNGTNNEVALEVESSLWYVELLIALLLLAAGICLLVGIFRHKAFLLLPFIILFGIIVVIEVLLTFLAILIVFFWVNLGTLSMLVFILVFLFVDTSCLLCVASHYLNLRAGREQMRAIYRSQGERLGDSEEGAAALPQKGAIPPDSNTMHFSTMSDMPVSSMDEEAPPPYRDV